MTTDGMSTAEGLGRAVSEQCTTNRQKTFIKYGGTKKMARYTHHSTSGSKGGGAGTTVSLTLLMSLLLTISAAPLSAQEGSTGIIEEVLVTGSRIERNNANSPQPISVVTGEDLRMTGKQDIGEVLNKNPALLSFMTSTNSIDSEPNNVGEADNIGGSALDLRGLGDQRTLTLVNGRRHVSGVEGTSSVDVTTIPSALIERVEVLTGGASAIYGAESS